MFDQSILGGHISYASTTASCQNFASTNATTNIVWVRFTTSTKEGENTNYYAKIRKNCSQPI